MDLDKFFLDLDEDEIAQRNAEREKEQTAQAAKLDDYGDCEGCKI